MSLLIFDLNEWKWLKIIIKETGATTIKDMGKIMKAAKEQIGTAADGRSINEVVKELLA